MSDNRDEREWITTFAKTPSEIYAKHREMLEVIKSQATELADAKAELAAAKVEIKRLREILEFLPDDDAAFYAKIGDLK